jgi:NifU-like protein involved in Fe-S cluster formation
MRGFRRRQAEPLGLSGVLCRDAAGLTAQFSLCCEGGRIVDLRFRACSCATLVAFCELITELAFEMRLASAAALTPARLIRELSGVPPLKQDRATLAVTAFRSAVVQAQNHIQGTGSVA